MTTKLVALSLFLFSQYILADEKFSCPSKSEINHQQGVYTSNDGKWLGVSLGTENNGYINSFMHVIYIPYKNLDQKIGTLTSCKYSLEFGSVDMYFRDEDSLGDGGMYLSIEGEINWLKSPELLYGSEAYMCTATHTNQCILKRLTHDIVSAYKATF
ncbi:Protein of uncharacterised function (DUF3757) [Yersinia kristensenii]|uniref:DUF3757 domain-containing protein n=1 Tax=Yersinia rochesterensis TaxID=1604335 RepID=A0A386HB82_9GAMM|nr:DUF3757 domain-containing protein [Yersinia rochesterensis]AYD42900.1 DUF3757 domain-containing protein [Yersinia rochesterensis]CNH18188.1 Protein of uncharacterised function (DUF3757) [Yersinia kristensenii]